MSSDIFDDETENVVEVSVSDVSESKKRAENIRSIIQSGELRSKLREYYDSEYDYTSYVEGVPLRPAVLTKPEWNKNRVTNGILSDIVENDDVHRDEGYIRSLAEFQASLIADDDAPTVVDLSKVLYNGNVYSVDSIKDNIEINLQTSDFFSYLSVCRAMADESYDRVINNKSLNGDIRNRYAQTDEDILSFSLPVVTGVCTATVLRSETGWEVLYTQRPMTVMQAPGLYAPVPSGMVETKGSDGEELTIDYTMLREFNEEVFGKDSDESDSFNELENVLSKDDVHHDYNTIFMPMNSPRVCISTLLYVDDIEASKYIRSNIHGNWEADTGIQTFSLPSSSPPPFLQPNSTANDGVGVFTEALIKARDDYGVELGFDLHSSLN